MGSPIAQLRPDLDPLATLDPVLLDALTKNAHEMVSIINTTGRILFSGGAIESITGYRPTDRIGRSVMDFVHADDYDYVLTRTRQFIDDPNAGDQSDPISARLQHRDGSYRHVEVTGTRLSRRGTPVLVVVHTRDVTRETRALEQSAAAQVQVDVALWAGDMMIWQLDLADTSLAVNGTAALERRGIDPCVGPNSEDRWAAQIHAADRQQVLESYGRQNCGEQARLELEYRVRDHAGTWHWLLERSQIVSRNLDGSARRVAGVCVCIDEQRELQQQLDDANERLRLAVAASEIAVWDWNVPQNKVRRSPEWFRVMGYAAAPRDAWTAIQTVGSVIAHPEDRPIAAAAVAPVLQGQACEFAFEVRRQTQSGDWRWMRTHGSVVARDQHGLPERIIGIVQDVHARRCAEDARRSLQSDVIENVPACIVLLNAQLQIRYATRSVLQQSPEQLRGQTVLSLFGADWHDQIREALARSKRDARNVELEGLIPAAASAAERRYRLHIAPAVGHDRDSQWCVVIRDISQVLRDESRAFLAIGQDQQRIGHDLREGVGQQLAGIAMLLQSLSVQLARQEHPLSSEAGEIATLVNHSVEDVRALSRSLSPVGVAPTGLAMAVGGLCEHARYVGRLNVECELNIADSHNICPVDADHLFGILTEAVSNVTRHAQAQNLWIRLIASPTRLELEVSDDGQGFAEDPIASRTTDGLALMRHRARGIGTTFSLGRRDPRGTTIRCLRIIHRSAGV